MNATTTPLPEWDLTDLYPARDAPELERDIASTLEAAKAFRARYEGKLAALDGAAMGRAIAEYEAMMEVAYRAGSYAQLIFAGDAGDPENGRFQQTISERLNPMQLETLFFTLEFNKLDDNVVEAMLRDPACAKYRPWIDSVRDSRPHQLSDELEQFIQERQVAGGTAWFRLFDETMADLRVPVDGKDLTLADALNMFLDPDKEKRRAAAKGMEKALGDNIRLFSLITNTLAKEMEIEWNWRNFSRPISARNLNNQVEDEVVEALASSVKAAFPDLSHRYYTLKAKWFGVGQMDYWDRNAPLPDEDDKVYSWDEAKALVLDAYQAFTPEMATIAGRFFDENWIDAALRPGKDSGAFSHSTVPSVHPYILMNFHGKSRDVMTLAHELGHGVHQVLATEQGHLQCHTSLPLAETASVFGEMLTFRSMLSAETDPRRRRALLAGKVEDMMNTVVRQIAFHEFETRVHDERREGELSSDRLGEIWMDVQRESLGPAFRFDPNYRHYWAYIPHFIHSPFYVYAYAFGDCLVNSLYRVHMDGHDGFQQKYLDMLRAGGTKRHKALLAPFGLDATDPGFWGRGLEMISGFVDELETMD